MKSIQYSLHREDDFWVAQCELYLEDSGDDYLEISDVSVGEELAYA